MRRIAVIALALSISACTHVDDLIPQGGPTMLEIYNGHLQKTGAVGTADQDVLAAARREAEARVSLGNVKVDPLTYTRDVRNEIDNLFPTLENPTLVMHVFPHLATDERLGADISLPPFAAALDLLDRRAGPELTEHPSLRQDDEHEELDRDILGEMEITAELMITGGDEREVAKFARSDRLVIRTAIVDAAKAVADKGRDTVQPSDVVAAMRTLAADAGLTDQRRDRIREMADSMDLITEPKSLGGQLFNRPGKPWPEADVTLVDLATLAREGYESELAITYVSLMNHINHVVERHQHERRQTLVITDEGHIITTNPLLSRYVVKITKMWRKLGAWYWLATQNLEDFPAGAKRMLNMMEWWLCLVMPKEEVDNVARFRELGEETKRLLLDARKEPGRYVEGVVLSDQMATIFRNVPPPLCLTLAMTEKHEKAKRAELMKRHGFATELDAAYLMADQIEGVSHHSIQLGAR